MDSNIGSKLRMTQNDSYFVGRAICHSVLVASDGSIHSVCCICGPPASMLFG